MHHTGGVGGSGDQKILHISSSWAKIMLQTEVQLPRLSGSSLKVTGGVGGQVKLQLMFRFSRAVTTIIRA